MNQLKKFDFTIKSGIIRGDKDKPYVGLEAVLAPNVNKMNQIVGYLESGTKVIISQRPGKGGMDFNKLLGGKVYAVASDGMSPVYEKDAEGKKTKIQKKEEGLPFFSSSGFYSLSSKDYPALNIYKAYTLLRDKGDKVWIITPNQINEKVKRVMPDMIHFGVLCQELTTTLGDEYNLVKGYDAAVNSKRERMIRRAKEDAEELAEAYVGAEYTELSVSKKEGNPFIMYGYQIDGEEIKKGVILREAEIQDETRDDGLMVTQYYTPEEAVERFVQSKAGISIKDALEAGKPVTFGFCQGHVMRTSVSFRKKMVNFYDPKADNRHGEGVYISTALSGWTLGIIALMQSQHPKFPVEDYDAHHYVALPRQAEVGMNKNENKSFGDPQGIHYSLIDKLMA
jgi:hypothetical protein